jgi:hypothetical protein
LLTRKFCSEIAAVMIERIVGSPLEKVHAKSGRKLAFPGFSRYISLHVANNELYIEDAISIHVAWSFHLHSS